MFILEQYEIERNIEIGKDLSIKQFKASNKRHSSTVKANLLSSENGLVGFQTSSFLEDVNGVQDFKMSFVSLFIWLSRSRPWDRQLEPPWVFFEENHYFQNEVFGNFERKVDPGKLCADFTDEILLANAVLFGAQEKHLTKQVSLKV